VLLPKGVLELPVALLRLSGVDLTALEGGLAKVVNLTSSEKET
jgi:hypothetical protein